MNSFRLICITARPKFLPGSVVLAFLGSAIAWRDGFFNAWVACLALCALLLWHISVNLLNDYFDYQSGIDLRTQRTVFSGGSGTLPSRQLSADLVLRFGLLTFALAIPLWVYLATAKGWPLVLLLLIEGLIVLLYTPVLTKWGLGEVASSLGLGVLSLLVFYFVQSGSYALDMVAPAVAGAAAPPGVPGVPPGFTSFPKTMASNTSRYCAAITVPAGTTRMIHDTSTVTGA